MNDDLAAWIAPFAPAGEMNVATLVQTEPCRECEEAVLLVYGAASRT